MSSKMGHYLKMWGGWKKPWVYSSVCSRSIVKPDLGGTLGLGNLNLYFANQLWHGKFASWILMIPLRFGSLRGILGWYSCLNHPAQARVLRPNLLTRRLHTLKFGGRKCFCWIVSSCLVCLEGLESQILFCLQKAWFRLETLFGPGFFFVSTSDFFRCSFLLNISYKMKKCMVWALKKIKNLNLLPISKDSNYFRIIKSCELASLNFDFVLDQLIINKL